MADEGRPSEPRRADAFERAVEALSRREHTTVELAKWLRERGFDAAEVEEAVGRLVEIGELDDKRFACRFAADKRELRGWGAERIGDALRARGLDRDLITLAVGADAEDELERATELLARRGGALADEAGRARALAYLARRGYDSETAYEAVRRHERRAA